MATTPSPRHTPVRPSPYPSHVPCLNDLPSPRQLSLRLQPNPPQSTSSLCQGSWEPRGLILAAKCPMGSDLEEKVGSLILGDLPSPPWLPGQPDPFLRTLRCLFGLVNPTRRGASQAWGSLGTRIHCIHIWKIRNQAHSEASNSVLSCHRQ